jgi:hypothetical protein
LHAQQFVSNGSEAKTEVPTPAPVPAGKTWQFQMLTDFQAKTGLVIISYELNVCAADGMDYLKTPTGLCVPLMAEETTDTDPSTNKVCCKTMPASC